MVKEVDLLQKKEVREEYMTRLEVLDSVGELLMLPNTEMATVKQVAEYFGVGIEAIQSLIKDNREELNANGYKVYKKSEILNVLKGQLENVSVPNRGMGLFTKRAITSLIFDNKDEMESNGYKVYKGGEINVFHVISFKEFTKNRGNYKFAFGKQFI